MSADVYARTDGLARWAFGDNPQLADALLTLVLAGTKTATCCPLWQYEAEAVAIPKTGERSIVLDGRGRPACVIEITDVAVRRFNDVDSAFAHDEGEGDRTLSYWRNEHETFFRHHGPFSTDMRLVCERFRVIEVLAREAGS